ncbi:MAG: PilZ domain-containing protein [Myxococcota bacterium]|nr:PilZ domain-containing protein [Myxococcota bacterium]
MTHVESGWQHRVPIENIGLGGARLAIDDELLPGDMVTLSFAATLQREAFVLRSRVVWVASPTSRAAVSSAPSVRPSGSDSVSAVETAASPRGIHASAGVAFQHTSARALLALYELISNVGD